jgi:hypothetical protein
VLHHLHSPKQAVGMPDMTGTVLGTEPVCLQHHCPCVCHKAHCSPGTRHTCGIASQRQACSPAAGITTHLGCALCYLL